MELITPTKARVLAYYDHPVWGKYAAVTQNTYGKGTATYIGCVTSNAVTEKIMENALKAASLWGKDQELKFPVIVKSGTNQQGKLIHYYFNYSAQPKTFVYPYKKATELLTGSSITTQSTITLSQWGFKIIEEQ